MPRPEGRRAPTYLVSFTDGGTVGDRDASPEPFEVPNLPPDAMGVVCVRPSAVFGRPGLQKYADNINKAIPAVCKTFGLSRALGLRVEEIAQMSWTVTLKTDPHAKGPQTAFMFGAGHDPRHEGF